ncbi:unnamed protein product, partial [Tilletia caries]
NLTSGLTYEQIG